MIGALGVGGSSPEVALASLSNMMEGVVPIAAAEYRARIARAQALMQAQSLAAIFLPAGTNLAYFTGTRWRPSERLVGALIPAHGELRYLAPYFEIGSFRDFSGLEAPIHAWHEHESPYRLMAESLAQLGISAGARVGLCESTPFFVYDGLRALATGVELVNATSVTAPWRMRKAQPFDRRSVWPRKLTAIESPAPHMIFAALRCIRLAASARARHPWPCRPWCRTRGVRGRWPSCCGATGQCAASSRHISLSSSACLKARYRSGRAARPFRAWISTAR